MANSPTLTAGGVHLTLAGTAADTITVQNYRNVLVWNNDTANPIYVRMDGATAVAAAAGTYIVPPRASLALELQYAALGAIVSVIGNGNAYSVMGL